MTGEIRILVVRLFAVGDIVRSMALLPVLRKTYPKATISWLVRRRYLETAACAQYVDELLVLNEPRKMKDKLIYLIKFFNGLRVKKYDFVINLQEEFWVRLLLRLMLYRSRHFFLQDYTIPRYTLGFFVKRRNGKTFLQEIRSACDGLVDLEETGRPEFIENELHRTGINAFLSNKCDPSRRTVVIHPPATHVRKQWPLEHFAELADLLVKDGRFNVILTCGPRQGHIVKYVCEKMTTKPIIGAYSDRRRHVIPIESAT